MQLLAGRRSFANVMEMTIVLLREPRAEIELLGTDRRSLSRYRYRLISIHAAAAAAAAVGRRGHHSRIVRESPLIGHKSCPPSACYIHAIMT